jgi:hypothetical protein
MCVRACGVTTSRVHGMEEFSLYRIASTDPAFWKGTLVCVDVCVGCSVSTVLTGTAVPSSRTNCIFESETSSALDEPNFLDNVSVMPCA